MYFLSFAVVGWIDVFTRKIYRDILVETLKYCQKEKGLEIYGWVVMSNHVHLIGRAKEGHELSAIWRDFKKYTSKVIVEIIQSNEQESRKELMLAYFKKEGAINSNNSQLQFWRQDNKSIELYSPEVTQQKMDYIHNNPVEAGLVNKPEDFLYSSAKNFLEEEGLIALDG